ncbi:MAG: elongation factor P maturation arginine rhamnosyltransferase EarP, partial [Oxalobacter sp.]
MVTRKKFNVDLFCEVIDNYGDAGVCWRLARQLASEWHCHVRLWIDRLLILQKIYPAIDAGLERQTANQVEICLWKQDMAPADVGQVPDVVIEGFGTRLPDVYLNQMAAKAVKPVWINLEYLSAESWVDSMHLMPSLYPRLPLTKYFYFPGFTAKTGGLIRERGLVEKVAAFQSDRKNAVQFLSSLGIACQEEQFIVSLFCYPTAPVLQLLETLQQSDEPVLCLIPEGTASQAVEQFIHGQPRGGTCFQRGALTVQIIPIIEQSRYDRLLWSSDLNFVRGEDSFVRAQWAGKPFVWQI